MAARKVELMPWTNEHLAEVGAADELAISSARDDGTLRHAVPIWVVRVGEDLYVRSYRGAQGAWYRRVLEQRAGHIRVAGLERDVILEPEAGEEVNAAVDDAYRAKYGRYGSSYVRQMTAPDVRRTTLRLVSR